ncbi:heterokaryon incompatibility protein-domain-containing protein [Xylariales sp. PMI_506]|nr:heterokaryon incompatibility protein-domain-containing protein [Xylariales sp. PMI_506]
MMYAKLKSHDSIRLVQIEPASNDNSPDQVHITIMETSLTAAPDFEAVSYTWGDPLEESVNLVMCQPTGVPVTMTQNCYSVLRRLRQPQERRTIWLDAVCINQGDIDERSAQVRMMGEIYARAKRVVIDIGQEAEDSSRALLMLQHCRTDVLYEFDSGKRIESLVEKLYKRPWFERVWVLQEVFRSRDAVVICGDTITPWNVFRPFSIWIDSRPANETEHWHVQLPFTIPQVLHIRNHSEVSYRGARDLLQLLVGSRICKASDPRDKVYALLPMLDQVPDQIEVDYSKSVVQVYTDTARFLVTSVGNLDILACAQQDRNRKSSDLQPSELSELPSWVPDWSQIIRTNWMIGYGDLYHPLSADGRATGSDSNVAEVRQSRLLVVRGVEVDTIISMTNEDTIISSKSTENVFAVNEFLGECSFYRDSLVNSPPAALLPEAPMWTPRTNEIRIHPPHWFAYSLGLPFENPNGFTDNDLIGPVMQFLACRRLALTSRGYIGIVPEGAKTGDAVCCLLGAKVPYVLRSTKQETKLSTSSYRLIGESYIYGLMNGEGFPKGDQVDKQLTDIIIV